MVTDDRDEQTQEKDRAGPSQRRPDVSITSDVKPRRVCFPCRWPARLRAWGHWLRCVGGRRRGSWRRRRLDGLRWQEDWHQWAEVQLGVAQDRAEIVALVLFLEVVEGEAVDVVVGLQTRDPLAVQPRRQLAPG